MEEFPFRSQTCSILLLSNIGKKGHKQASWQERRGKDANKKKEGRKEAMKEGKKQLYSKTLDGSVPANAGDSGNVGVIPGSGSSLKEGNGTPLQYSCLDNLMAEEPGKLQSMGLQRVGHN